MNHGIQPPLSPPNMGACVPQLKATSNTYRGFVQLEEGTPSSGNDPAQEQGTWPGTRNQAPGIGCPYNAGATGQSSLADVGGEGGNLLGTMAGPPPPLLPCPEYYHHPHHHHHHHHPGSLMILQLPTTGAPL